MQVHRTSSTMAGMRPRIALKSSKTLTYSRIDANMLVESTRSGSEPQSTAAPGGGVIFNQQ